MPWKSICPKCSTPRAAEASHCSCGYAFVSPTPKTGNVAVALVAEELVAKAEALYESHLVARVVHARRQLKDAKVAVLRDPRDPAKAVLLKQAEEIARGIQAQLVEQSRKTADAQEIAERARTNRTSPPVSNPAPAPETPTTPEIPSDSFRAAQTARANVAVSTANNEHSCPACGRRHPNMEMKCGCGYTFHPPGKELPPVRLSESERAVLRALHLLEPRSKNG